MDLIAFISGKHVKQVEYNWLTLKSWGVTPI